MSENVVRQVLSAEDQLLGLVIAGQLHVGTRTVMAKENPQVHGEWTGSTVTASASEQTPAVAFTTPGYAGEGLLTPPVLPFPGHLPKVPSAHCYTL